MSKAWMLAAALAVAGAAQAGQRPGDWAVGVAAGYGTGLTGKTWLGDSMALDVQVGSLGLGPLTARAGLLYHRFGLFASDRDDLTWKVPVYWGGSVLTVFDYHADRAADTVRPGALATFGIAYIFPEPFELFAEVSPAVVFGDQTHFGFLGAVGARVYLDARPIQRGPAPKAKTDAAPAVEQTLAVEPEPVAEPATPNEAKTKTAVRRVGGAE